MKITSEWIDKQIEKNTKLAINFDELGFSNDYRPNKYWRMVYNLEECKPIADYDVDAEFDLHGHLIVNNKYEFVFDTNNWCVADRYKWYKSRGLEDFLKRFVKAKKKIEKNE